MVNLDCAVQHVLARYHKTQRMTDPLGRGLTYTERLGETNRGQAFVRLQQQPHRLEPYAQGKFRGVQGRMRCHRELEPAITTGALIETWPRTALTSIAARPCPSCPSC
jgi:hypothetical protein